MTITEEEIIITTTDTISGKEIVKFMGMIEARCGRFVRSEEKSARENLIQKAVEKGANAIVGYSYAKMWARGTAILIK